MRYIIFILNFSRDFIGTNCKINYLAFCNYNITLNFLNYFNSIIYLLFLRMIKNLYILFPPIKDLYFMEIFSNPLNSLIIFESLPYFYIIYLSFSETYIKMNSHILNICKSNLKVVLLENLIKIKEILIKKVSI